MSLSVLAERALDQIVEHGVSNAADLGRALSVSTEHARRLIAEIHVNGALQPEPPGQHDWET
jgi:hypothetical protein